MNRVILAALLVLMGTSFWGQTASKQAVLIKAGRLFDPHTGHMLTDQAILVQGDKIQEVGDSRSIAAHAVNARVIDLSSATVLPGFVDAHAHVLGNPKDFSPIASLRMSSAQAALWGVHNLNIWLEHGFTTVRDACEPDPYYAQIALRESIARGLIKGPRLITAGGCLSLTGGHGDTDQLASDQALLRRPNLADNVDEIAVASRRDIKYGADWIKLMATGGVMDTLSDFRVQELSEEQMAKAVEIAHRANKKVMAHAHAAEGIRAAVRAGVDSIEHGSLLDDEGAELMVEKHVWLVPTIEVSLHVLQVGPHSGIEPVMIEKEKHLVELKRTGFACALRHHVRIALGTDDDPDFSSAEFTAMASWGMEPAEVLKAATLNGAELLGLSSTIGSIDPGKYADIVAVNGDPLIQIKAVEDLIFVMHGGEIIKLK